ncbi:Phage late control gene D protein (GPD) [Aquisphaera giovannonii]|uniref:Phage late control gene D protein (GPD) n=1 Tax=Aquisphaera giovannonii TaxID=406548 RepID=A0A5B9W827_9BACT|nr:phage late control D family protein [Aquisphaera giovannonii]QEH36497.1 Phage late control gene D protein (GPD) [Aquisphaera giovannonii]
MLLPDGLTSLNNPRGPSGIARSPRPYVLLNGVRLPVQAVESLEVTNASHFTADTFRLQLAVGGLPADYGPAYWADSQFDQLSIGVSMNGETPRPLIVGQVDDIDWNPVGTEITLTGRDLSAALIDNKTAEKFQNQTSSQIAQTLALRRGLDSDVQATTTLAGTYYEIDHAIATHEETEWDLLTYLAQREGFDVWVSGTTLYFQPSPSETNPPYLLLVSRNADGSFVSNGERISLRRSQTLARDVIVKVRSWNQKQQRAFTVTAKRSQAKKGQRVGGEAQTYSFVRPNLTQEQAQRVAESLAEDITRHERVLNASLPGDNELVTRSMVRLVGTGTGWDQLYYPDIVTRRLSMAEGYRMELKAKNHSTQDTVLA